MAKRSATATRKPPALRHLEGCPEDPERIEVYGSTRPNGDDVEITRCVDCAVSKVADAGGSNSNEGDA